MAAYQHHWITVTGYGCLIQHHWIQGCSLKDSVKILIKLVTIFIKELEQTFCPQSLQMPLMWANQTSRLQERWTPHTKREHAE